MSERWTAIDVLRGIAIILMVIFHVIFTLWFFRLSLIDPWSSVWHIMARVVQITFISTTGMTLYLSYKKFSDAHGKKKAIKRRLFHAGKLFLWALGISLVTWFLYKNMAVRFGILHFLSVAMVLSLPFLHSRNLTLIVGLLILIFAPLVVFQQYDHSMFFLFGLVGNDFISLDYFPLFPWMGVFLLGVFVAQLVSDFQWSKYMSPQLFSSKGFRPLTFLGKRSLLVYLVHYPVILTLLAIYFVISGVT